MGRGQDFFLLSHCLGPSHLLRLLNGFIWKLSIQNCETDCHLSFARYIVSVSCVQYWNLCETSAIR